MKDKIVRIAMSEIGTRENPANSNNTKFGVWFGLNHVAWCGIFVSWCYYQAGLSLGNIGYLKGFAGVKTAVAFFRKENKIVTDPEPGDIVFYDFKGKGNFEHTGIFVCDNGDQTFTAVEGNTCDSSIGNQSAGGEVCKKIRHFGNHIFARSVENIVV